MLESGATHSFVYSCIVQSMATKPSQGAVLTITVANGSKVLCYDVRTLTLMFAADGRPPGDRVIKTVCTQLFVNQYDTWDRVFEMVQSISKLA